CPTLTSASSLPACWTCCASAARTRPPPLARCSGWAGWASGGSWTACGTTAWLAWRGRPTRPAVGGWRSPNPSGKQYRRRMS
ncbi:MAG: hypothetical protein AVDCRST_MAG77-657, partial [uncultured Chloroflexi bacterium]